MKNILFIINPIAGTPFRRGDKQIIYDSLQEKEYNIELFETQYPKHGKQIAADAVSSGNIDTIIVAGGDGSINDVASVLVGTSITLGIIPTGSGNGLAHHLQIPIHFKKALEVIRQGNVLAIDAGMIEQEAIGKKYFFSNCGIGYDAEVIHAYDQVKQRGFLTYLRFLFQSVFTLKPKQLTITMNGETEVLAPFIFTVANSSQYGYKIKAAPDASITDGILDVLMVRKSSFLQIVKLAVFTLANIYGELNDLTEFFKTKHIHILFDEETKLQIDGEAFLVSGTLDISVLNQSLHVLVPKI